MHEGGAILLALICILMIPGLTIYFRHREQVLKHEERMQAIEKGVALPVQLEGAGPQLPFTPRVYLLRGLIWLFAGTSISIVIASVSLSVDMHPPVTVRYEEALRMREMGATEGDIKQYLADPNPARKGIPLGAASLGLIPASVGMALLIFYKKETEQRQ